MRRLGVLLHYVGGVYVVRCEEGVRPELGLDVLDPGLNHVGMVVDVFGPVENPYAVVERVGGAEPGDKLYMRGGEPN